MESFDAIVLGAGAAGLMCALTAGQRGRRVLLLEHLDQPGAKILISGGGRCNFTNLDAGPERFLSNNPHFCKSALARYTQHDFIAMVERHGIAYHEKTLGQLFCDGSSRAIVAMLKAECDAGGVDLRLGHRITNVTRPERFRVETSGGVFEASALVLATGGPSIPKMGATGFAYDLARKFDLAVVEPRAALVPLKVAADILPFFQSLSGVATDAIVACGKTAFREAILFTHRGLSGPAILQISSYWRPGEAITLDIAPEFDALAFLKERRLSRAKAEPKTILAEFLPVRLAQALTESVLPPAATMANLPDTVLETLARRVQRWEIAPSGTEGWAKAEVTAGGIDTDALSSRTMEARQVPGLHAIGEAVDVTGWLGGYNFQWAWSSGWCAGRAI